jgi:hypothetical protein
LQTQQRDSAADRQPGMENWQGFWPVRRTAGVAPNSATTEHERIESPRHDHDQ